LAGPRSHPLWGKTQEVPDLCGMVVLCGWYGEVIFVTDIFGWFADFVRVRSERFLDVIVCV
jgi:hypothetical protein